MTIQLTAQDALVIIDPQFDFLDGGRLGTNDSMALLPAIMKLTPLFKTVVITQDWHPANHKSFASVHGVAPFSMVKMPYGDQVAWPDHCIQGTQGAALAIQPDNVSMILRKGMNPELDSYSAYYENDHVTSTGLTGFFRGLSIKRAFHAGFVRNYCLGFSAIDSANDGFESYVFEDATIAIQDGTNHDMTGKLMKAGVKRTYTNELDTWRP